MKQQQKCFTTNVYNYVKEYRIQNINLKCKFINDLKLLSNISLYSIKKIWLLGKLMIKL